MIDSDPRAFAHDSASTYAQSKSAVTVLGAGPAGSLLSILLAARGHRVTVLERLPDLRHAKIAAGRSINLALADRGIHALKIAGVFHAIEPLLIPMRGRMVHDELGRQSLQRYGSDPHEAIYSVSRARLTGALLDFAERERNVEFRFRQNCISVDPKQRALCIQDIPTGKVYPLPLKRVIGADGAGSVLRKFMVEAEGAVSDEEMHTHGYKELNIAPNSNGEHRIERNALHVWPRGEFMLIALPNLDGSFTATLFLPLDGPQSFASLHSAAEINAFFAKHFPDAFDLIADLPEQFAAHPTGSMRTVRCDRWLVRDELLLIGDAAHAVVPFHGQGMNCAFEDCVEFDTLLEARDWTEACSTFQARRKPNCDAIAAMALENYVTMRDSVRDPKYRLQNELAFELERRFKNFIPRYSMVMFHHEISYAEAYERGRIQAEILSDLTREADSLQTVDFTRAAALIESKLTAI